MLRGQRDEFSPISRTCERGEAARALAVVHQDVPVMGAGEIHGVTSSILEIAGVVRVDAQRGHAEGEGSTYDSPRS